MANEATKPQDAQDRDYRPDKFSLSNGEIEATGILAGGAVSNIAREAIRSRQTLAAQSAELEQLRAQNARLKAPVKWVDFVERRESMSPDGILRVQRQSDGDVIVTILSADRKLGYGIASVEFCTPMCGGGRSEHTWKALIELAAAMERDNEEAPQTIASRANEPQKESHGASS